MYTTTSYNMTPYLSFFNPKKAQILGEGGCGISLIMWGQSYSKSTHAHDISHITEKVLCRQKSQVYLLNGCTPIIRFIHTHYGLSMFYRVTYLWS